MSFSRYPGYKDSGVKWLGEIPTHWDVCQSRRLFTVRNESAITSDKQLTASQEHGVIYQEDFVRLEGRRVVEVIKGLDSLKHVEPDDFVISMRSFQGGIEWSKLRGSISWHYVMLVPVKNVYPPFFAHLFKSLTYIQALRATTDLVRDGQELRYSHFVQVALPLVPVEEQAAIASFLDRETAKIDALVAEQERLIKLLNEKRQAVISQAVAKGLNPDAPMKDSGITWLGQIPVHWSVRELRHLIADGTTITYGIVQAGPDTEGGVPYIRTSDMSGDALPMSGYLRTTHEIDASYRRSKVRHNDLVVAIRASLGKGLLVPAHLEGANLTQGTARVSPGAGLLPKFLLRAFNSDYCQTSIRIAAKGTTFLEITLDELRRVPLAVPPLQEQAEIVESIDAQVGQFDHLMDEAVRAAQLLQERRAALISAAVTGQIDVRGLADRAAA